MPIMYVLKDVINKEVLIYLESLCSKNILWLFFYKSPIRILKIQKDNINLNFLMECKKKEIFRENGSIVVNHNLKWN